LGRRNISRLEDKMRQKEVDYLMRVEVNTLKEIKRELEEIKSLLKK
jgi:hypothetical protein